MLGLTRSLLLLAQTDLQKYLLEVDGFEALRVITKDVTNDIYPSGSVSFGYPSRDHITRWKYVLKMTNMKFRLWIKFMFEENVGQDMASIRQQGRQAWVSFVEAEKGEFQFVHQPFC